MAEPTGLEKMEPSTLKNIASAKAGLQKQAGVARQGVQAVDTAEQGAMKGIGAESARAFAADRARGGGGSLARMRQGALSRGVAEGQMAGEFAGQRQDAQERAARAETDLATETEKLDAKAREFAQQGATGYQDVVNELNQYVKDNDIYFMNQDDRAAFAAGMQQKIDAEPNPQRKGNMQKALNDILAGDKGSTGAVDIEGSGAWYNPVNWF